jgi:hypothetical protein
MDTVEDDARVWTWWADDGVHWVLVVMDGDNGPQVHVLGPDTKPFFGPYEYLLIDADAIVDDIMTHFSSHGDKDAMVGVRQWLTRSLRGD